MNKWPFLFLILSSCAYRLGTGDPRLTVSIPYVVGDEKGELTRELIYAVSSSNQFSYTHAQSDAVLHVEILSTSDDKIGYKRDRLKEDGSFKKNLRATEGRTNLAAKVSLVSGDDEEKQIWGPEVIKAFVDYDYVDGDALEDLSFIDSSGNRETVLRFSLGQLEESFSARDASKRPLYQALSQKIIDVLSGSCGK